MIETEEELTALLHAYGLAWYEGGKIDADDFQAAILAAFTKLKDERDALQNANRVIIETNFQLRGWIDDLQSGMYINCVYCGHRYGPSDKTPASKAEMLKQHIEICPDHPMSKLKVELAAALELAERTSKMLEECNHELTLHQRAREGRDE